MPNIEPRKKNLTSLGFGDIVPPPPPSVIICIPHAGCVVTHVPSRGCCFPPDWCRSNSAAGRTSPSPVGNSASRATPGRMCVRCHKLPGSSMRRGEPGNRSRSLCSCCTRVAWLGRSLLGAITTKATGNKPHGQLTPEH